MTPSIKALRLAIRARRADISSCCCPLGAAMRQIGRRSNTPPPVVAAAVFSVPYHYANGIAATWDTIDRYSGKLTALPFMFPEARQAYLYVSRLYRILKAKGQI